MKRKIEITVEPFGEGWSAEVWQLEPRRILLVAFRDWATPEDAWRVALMEMLSLMTRKEAA